MTESLSRNWLTGLAAADLQTANLERAAMPWNEANRVKYDVIRGRYSTDMSDAEFELILPPLLHQKAKTNRPMLAPILNQATGFGSKSLVCWWWPHVRPRVALRLLFSIASSSKPRKPGDWAASTPARQSTGRKRYLAVNTLGVRIAVGSSPR